MTDEDFSEIDTTAAEFDAMRAAFPDARITVGGAMTEFEQATVKQRAPLSSACAEKTFGYKSQYSLRQGLKKYGEICAAFKSGAGVNSGSER